jgi:hypothetical protein
MKQLKIRSRVYCGFGTIMAVGLGVACFGIHQSMQVGRQVETM